MKTIEEFIKEMESTNILTSRECTFKEYASELLRFQDMICKIIAGDAYHEDMRIDEAQFLLDSTARKKGLRSHPAVHNGILTMKKLSREMKITLSGAKGENLVSKTLEYLDRPNTKIFRNVFISDGVDETELDSIVLTDNGIIILEMKNVKTDLTLTEEGRMVFAGDECYEKAPLCEKMSLKRRLLKRHLEKAIADKGMSIPVYVDSFIVFSAPKGQFIRIDDRYHKEKHCFRTGLNKKIEAYLGCAYYNADQLTELGDIISAMETNIKRFETSLNYDEVRHSLAAALAVLEDNPAVPGVEEANSKASESAKHTTKVINLHARRQEDVRQQPKRKASGFGYVIASVVASLLISGAAVALTAGSRRT